MEIYVDIDKTIASSPLGTYELARPIQKNIEFINDLYEKGHRITYWTGRGTVTKIDWYPMTRNQLESWGCKYHELKMGKPAFDLFIDDKAINSMRFFDLPLEEISSIIQKDV